MRRVFSHLSRSAAVLTILALLLVPVTALADDGPFSPPDAKIGPPIGGNAFVGAHPRTGLTVFDWLLIVWLAAKIGPPIG
jgi:peptidoglycan/LPS O-acetylase OafA/YrhL